LRVVRIHYLGFENACVDSFPSEIMDYKNSFGFENACMDLLPESDYGL